MKKLNNFVLLLVLATSTNFASKAQSITPGVIANFGMDGDVSSGQSLTGSFLPSSTDDWFFQSQLLNSGNGIIDTTGATAIKSALATGVNFVFSKSMSYPRFSIQNGRLLMDARYIRDNIGLSGSIKDSTVYTNGAKNGMIPSDWGTNANGSTVTDKTDIVDAYAHMRRAGTSTGHLVILMGASTSGTTGNRFIDLELYKSRIAYNNTTGVFSNSGPTATGGHSAWAFNANGTINQIGDMDFSFSFSSTSITEIAVYIWVDKATVQNITPAGFDFSGTTEFYGAQNNSTYGYAKIIAKNGAALPVWGDVNTSSVSGPVWGTNSKVLGASGVNYFSTNYSTGQMAEVAIDLTAMGIDGSGFNDACTSPFTRMMVKSRSSASFTSALSDFAGPAAFLDAPIVPASIMIPGILKCNVSTVTLVPQTSVAGGVYTWSTINGNILSDVNSQTISVNKPGKYYLTTAAAVGCAQLVDSITVREDIYQPVATANTTGLLGTGLIAMVLGGDENASNYATEFGGSAGLNWQWSGPLSFASTSRDNVVAVEGLYTLIVTEQRNGCSDTAKVAVAAAAVLPVKLGAFTAANLNGVAVLNWNTVTETNLARFEIERSFDGSSFKTIGQVKAVGNSNVTVDYSYMDSKISNKNFYRLKMIDYDGTFSYSKVVSVTMDIKGVQVALVYPNPFAEKIQLQIISERAEQVVIKIINNEGKVVKMQSVSIAKGTNNILMNNVADLGKGIYYLELISGMNTTQMKMVKV
ncbi:MAG: T9SS type A sorting domain-containing protein [Ferruginibacter sp.]|nr:T9SS type A sorting domain-containing protein [Ferruginibacter sp.]